MSKNYDPPMHSVEHILNQTMVRLFDCGRSVNAHIEKKKSRIDYKFNRDLTLEEKTEIENRVNEIIKKDLPVTEEYITRDEAEKKYNLRKLPEDAGDKIRIIHIGDYDSVPCSGVHVKSTAEIGKFKILSSTYENNILRLRFKLERTTND